MDGGSEVSAAASQQEGVEVKLSGVCMFSLGRHEFGDKQIFDSTLT